MNDLSEARGYACIGLSDPKFAANVGGAIRAAYCYRANMIAIQGTRHNWAMNAPTDTYKGYRTIPVLRVAHLRDVIPFDCVPVAVELVKEAVSIVEYKHPERAFYVFGAEDSTLDQRVLSWCRDIIYVPTNRCMNLSATVNVVLYDRMAKPKRPVGGLS